MSDKNHANPYRSGLYQGIFGHLKQKQVVTRQELVDFTMKTLGKSEAAANAAVTVILSPRKASKIGDCRGNISSNGHLYYMAKLGRQVHAGVRDPQKFRLQWRVTALEPRTRQPVAEVKQVKTPAVKAKAPAKVATKETLKA